VDDELRPDFPYLLDLGGDLALRAIDPLDAPEVYAVVDASRDHLRRWLPWVDATEQPDYTRDFFEHVAEERERGVTAAYLILDCARIAGMIGLHEIDWTDGSFMIGYWLAPWAEGRGHVTRACEHLVRYAFEEMGLERAVIRAGVGNTRSAKVAHRLGFSLEGIERHGQRLHGVYIDLEVYSLLRGDWAELPPTRAAQGRR
jgi:ribosomal-protein-serine acetyltransferase